MNELLEQIRSNPLSIEFIANPSEDLQIEAIKLDYRAIQFIKNPSYEDYVETDAAIRAFAREYIKKNFN